VVREFQAAVQPGSAEQLEEPTALTRVIGFDRVRAEDQVDVAIFS